MIELLLIEKGFFKKRVVLYIFSQVLKSCSCSDLIHSRKRSRFHLKRIQVAFEILKVIPKKARTGGRGAIYEVYSDKFKEIPDGAISKVRIKEIDKVGGVKEIDSIIFFDEFG
jgi:hypothetical protein